MRVRNIVLINMGIASPYIRPQSTCVRYTLSNDGIVNNRTASMVGLCDIHSAILKIYMIIKVEEVAVLQVVAHYY